ncbi:MAG: pentapeptide repeat-containing protein [Desulforegulaceae bacterium]|nr:pentapeptide repeat-containing protein [Desulforegulaceae bacterium]
MPHLKKIYLWFKKNSFNPLFKDDKTNSIARFSVFFLFILYSTLPYIFASQNFYVENIYCSIAAAMLFFLYIITVHTQPVNTEKESILKLKRPNTLNIIIFILGSMFAVVLLNYFSHFFMITFFEVHSTKKLSDIADILTKLFATCAVLIAAYIGWQRVEVHRAGQITDSFIRANEQLGAVTSEGKPQIETRLGGIYALEKIAKENKEEYFCVVFDILTAYVRLNSPNNNLGNIVPLREDILIIIEILKKTDLSFYYERDKRINLTSSNLICSNFYGANLKKALFHNSDLREAIFTNARLEGANFTDANLEKASLENARLEKAFFENTNLANTEFRRAKLHSAYMKKSRNLRYEQIDIASGNQITSLPRNLSQPKHWV